MNRNKNNLHSTGYLPRCHWNKQHGRKRRAKLQLQERLAGDIIKMLEGALQDEKNPPKGFAIMMKGTHLCKSMRGVKKNGSMTVLHCTGIFKTDRELQKQFIDIAEKQI